MTNHTAAGIRRAHHTSEYTTGDSLNTFEYPTEIVRWGDGQ